MLVVKGRGKGGISVINRARPPGSTSVTVSELDGIDDLILAMGGWKTVSGASAITPSIAINKPSDGVTSPSIWVAPCAIMFDATGTIDSAVSDPLLDCYYYWDYGDTAKENETWPYGARPGTQSKNKDAGIVAGHVYDTPGTYTATLTVLDSYGNINVATQQIIVSDPDIVFSGTKTICVSNDADFTGAPEGSTQITSSNYSTVINAQIVTLTADKRILFKCGDVFDIDATINGKHGVSRVQIGSFGTGDKPEIRFTETSAALFFINLSDDADTPSDDIQIYGLKITNPFGIYGTGGASSKRFISVFNKTNRETIRSLHGRMTVYQVECVDVFGMSVGGYGGAVAECVQTTPLIDTYGTGVNGFYSSSISSTIFIGNSYNQGRAGEHTVRFQGCRRIFIAHNEMLNPSDTKHCLAVRGSTVGSLNAPVVWAANTIYDNGRLVYPTTDDLRLFRRTTRSPGATAPYASGAVEPNWATAVNIGDEVTDNDYLWELEYIRAVNTDKFVYISNFINIRDNKFEVEQERTGYTNSLLVQIACGSPTVTNEPIEYAIFEQNYIAPDNHIFINTTHKALELQGKHLAVRNNIIHMGLGGAGHIIFTIRGTSASGTPACDDVRIENNSTYSIHTGVKGVYAFDPNITNTVIRNTLFYAPNAVGDSLLVIDTEPGITIENSTADLTQMTSTNPGYATVPPVGVDDFKVATGYGVGNGGNIGGIFTDFYDVIRDRRAVDMGAIGKDS
jgi:hypothetical protein